MLSIQVADTCVVASADSTFKMAASSEISCCWGDICGNTCPVGVVDEFASRLFESLKSSDLIDVFDTSEIDSVVDISPSDFDNVVPMVVVRDILHWRGEIVRQAGLGRGKWRLLLRSGKRDFRPGIVGRLRRDLSGLAHLFRVSVARLQRLFILLPGSE